jgi:PBP1b-binding outer membrane lipoprotein LpoB
MKRTKRAFFVLLGCVLLAGCAGNRYIAPVTAFQTSTNQTISVISAFYTSRNSYETQLYLSDIAADPTSEMITCGGASCLSQEWPWAGGTSERAPGTRWM